MKNSKEIDDFEKKIFDKENNPNIKYNIDHSIEASVKYEFLIENFGKERVDSLVKDFHELYDHDQFNIILQKLQNT